MVYDDKFYSDRNDRTAAAASRIIRIVRNAYPFDSMIDVGCGVGTWLSVALDQGATHAEGIEGPWLNQAHVTDTRITIHRQDLGDTIQRAKSFDFALSLEVGEHLPETRAHSFVGEICALAPCVLFGAAMPGQTGGVGHVNLQWQGWWAEIFRKHGHLPVDLVRPQVWHESAIPLWYRQNPILYVRPDLMARIGMTPCSDRFIADLVHPEMFLRHHRPRPGLGQLLRRMRRRSA